MGTPATFPDSSVSSSPVLEEIEEAKRYLRREDPAAELKSDWR
jgi:hypothetical protein